MDGCAEEGNVADRCEYEATCAVQGVGPDILVVEEVRPDNLLNLGIRLIVKNWCVGELETFGNTRNRG